MQVFGTVTLARDHVVIVDVDNSLATLTLVLDGRSFPEYQDGEKVMVTMRPQGVTTTPPRRR